MKWKKSKIGNHCEITSSKRIFYSEYVDSGVPFYRSKEIIEIVQGQQISEPLYISEHKYNEIKKRFGVPVAGDMLLTSVGTIGVPYVIKPDDRFYFKDGNLTWFRNFDDYLLSKFLCYWIGSKEGYSVLNNTTIGSSQKALTITSLNQIECPMPKTDIQLKIVEILSVYDDLIENNQKQIKLLEEAAQRLYKEWFVDLHFPGHEQTRIVDGVPENWSVQLLSQVFSYVRGKSYSSSDIVDDRQAGISLINLNSIKPFGGYKRNAEKRYLGKVNDNQFVNAGDVLMGVTDMTQERRLVGHVALVPNLRKQATFSMDLIKLEPFTVPKYYLYASLRYGGYSNRIAQLANGVNVLHLKPESIMNLKMPIPQISILKKFDEVFASYQKKIEILENQMSLASEARDRLLPKLMNGEIEL